MVDDNIVEQVLGKSKEIAGIEKVDDTKILIDTDDKLLDSTLKNVVV